VKRRDSEILRRGVYPELDEILRYAQNDSGEGLAQNDSKVNGQGRKMEVVQVILMMEFINSKLSL